MVVVEVKILNLGTRCRSAKVGQSVVSVGTTDPCPEDKAQSEGCIEPAASG